MPNPIPLTSAQVAARLGITTRTVARLIARGEFPNAYKLGGNVNAPYAIPESDLIAYEKKLAPPPRGGRAS